MEKMVVSKKDYDNFEKNSKKRIIKLSDMYIFNYDGGGILCVDVFIFLRFRFTKISQIFDMKKSEFEEKVKNNKRLLNIAEGLVRNEPLNWKE